YPYLSPGRTSSFAPIETTSDVPPQLARVHRHSRDLEECPRVFKLVWVTGSDREEYATLRTLILVISHLSCKGVYRCEIFFLQPWMLFQNFGFGHAVRQPAEHIVYGDSHAANAGLPVPFVCLNSNAR